MAPRLDPKSAPAVPVRDTHAEDHVQYRIDHPPTDLLIEVIEMTPGAAKVALTANTHNRNLSPAHQARLAGFMFRGVWYPATTVIAFDKTGKMVNGQHTCGGVSDSGTTQTMICAWGVDTKTQAVYDTQSKRTVAQALALEDEDISGPLASVLKVIFQIENNTGDPTRWVPEPTPIEYASMVDDEVREAAAVAVEVKKSYGKTSVPVSVIGAAYYFCAKVDPDLADLFFTEMRPGGGNTLHGAGQLRAYFLNRPTRGSQSRPEQVVMYDTVIRAFNKDRKGVTTALFSKKTTVPNRWTLPR